jgi:hypothetical protein
LWLRVTLFELAGLYIWFRDSTSLKPLLVVAMLMGIGYLLTAKCGTLTCDFDKSGEVMTLKRQGLFGRKTVNYLLEEITAIEVVESMGKLFIFYYEIRLILKTEVLYLTTEPLYTNGEASNLGNFVARFLDVPFKYFPTLR